MTKPVQWSPDGYPIFTDPTQFQKWEKERRKEIIEEIQDAFNETAYAHMVALYGAEVKRLGNAVEKLEEMIDQLMLDMNQLIKYPISLSYDPEMKERIDEGTKFELKSNEP